MERADFGRIGVTAVAGSPPSARHRNLAKTKALAPETSRTTTGFITSVVYLGSLLCGWCREQGFAPGMVSHLCQKASDVQAEQMTQVVSHFPSCPESVGRV